MTEKVRDVWNRRRWLKTVGTAGLGVGVAGCSGDGNGGNGGNGDGTSTATTTATEQSTATPTDGEGSGSDGVSATVSLGVRSSQSNVDSFRTLQTTFEALELVASDGTTVRLDETTMDVDLTEVGAGGSVDLFEATVPAGDYTEAKLYLPIRSATLADGGDPEFTRTVPASREVRGDPITVRSGGSVEITTTVALVRVAGDGPWTYTLGWGVR